MASIEIRRTKPSELAPRLDVSAQTFRTWRRQDQLGRHERTMASPATSAKSSRADHMRAELVVDALQMALHRRRPDPGLICHSDQGSHRVFQAFGQKARDAGAAQAL